MTFVFDEAMRSYYDQRASEYDDWWLGTGQFARRDRPGWADEVAQLLAVVAALPPARVLDVGCGTGFLSAQLAGEVVALDQSTAMLQIAGERLPRGLVLCGEAVPLPFHDDEFDRVFTSHFYGHLQRDERTDFLAEARRVASQLVVVDSALREDVQPEEWQERVLDDGTSPRSSAARRCCTTVAGSSPSPPEGGGAGFATFRVRGRGPATAHACDRLPRGLD